MVKINYFKNHRPYVRFDGDRVIKSGDPRRIQLEVKKTQAAFELSKETNLFRVPRVISHDQKKGIYVQERIHGIKNIQKRAAYGNRKDSLWSRVGESLALIHANYRPKDCLEISLPAPWGYGGSVWIHGDFNLVNINTVKATNEIVIIDWCTTARINNDCTVGSAMFDVGWFLKSMFHLPSFYVFPILIEEKAMQFLEGYSKRRGTLDIEQLSVVARASSNLFKENFGRGKIKNKLVQINSQRLERFIRGLDVGK